VGLVGARPDAARRLTAAPGPDKFLGALRGRPNVGMHRTRLDVGGAPETTRGVAYQALELK